ncbi:MAG: hypothetical protein IPL94_07855 [Tetrasphaera sp.]|nr:hypothetical protein [Tetrasphaera sp.]
MSTPERLAVIDHGEPAVRVIAACARQVRSDGRPVTTLAVVTGSAHRAWWSREADEVLDLGSHADLEPQVLVEALRARGVDAVWFGALPGRPGPTTDLGLLADHVAACEDAGLLVVGPSSKVLRSLSDDGALGRLAESAGVRLATEHATGPLLSVDLLRDREGRVWSLGVRDTVTTPEGLTVLSEYPASNLGVELSREVVAAGRALIGAAGLLGAAVARFRVDEQGVGCVAFTPSGRPEHALVEESSGVSLVEEQLRIAAGDGLEGDAPAPDGQVVEVALLARDLDRRGLKTGGRVELLSLPSGTGVRVDTALREGDVLDAHADPVIATITAWGRTREEALGRALRAVGRTGVVLSDGATNRCGLVALLSSDAVRSGPVTSQWYAEQLTAGAFRGDLDPVALVAAAVEVYDQDFAAVRQAFRASAARGRPTHPEAVGSRVQLRYGGRVVGLRVDRVGSKTYRIRSAGDVVDAVVEHLGPHELRLSVAGRKHTVITASEGDAIRIELDGVAHCLTREDGVVVRTGWPALVESLRVEVGDRVTKGQPLAVLESMKMVTTVGAPLAGVVTSVEVLPNEQVEGGAPLLRIKADDDAATTDEEPVGERVTLAELAGHEAPGRDDVFGAIRDYLLGYDLDPAGLTDVRTAYARLVEESDPGDPVLLAREDAILDLYAELAALYRPRTEAESASDDLPGAGNAQEYLHAFLQWLDPDRAGIPDRYRKRLVSVLARYDGTTLQDSDGLLDATVWMFRAFSRVPELTSLVVEMLGRRLRHLEVFRGLSGPEERARLHRLVQATQGRQQGATDAARDVLFHVWDEPVLSRVVEETTAEMAEHLHALAGETEGARRGELIDRLVWSPHPLRSLLLRAWMAAETRSANPTAYREAILESYTRRFYRIRDLQDLRTIEVDGHPVLEARYTHEGAPIRLVVSYVALDDLPAMSRLIGHQLTAEDASDAPLAVEATGFAPAARERVIVDLVTWRSAERPSIEEMAQHVEGLLAEVDFGRPLHRLDLTITSLVGDGPERDRTQHLTYRQPPGTGFVEDVLYRNMHSMLGKRLDLWRLSNFVLTRLPSPEDVYLFDGVARNNPKDHRLFALAEVRDLTPVTDDAGVVSYPRLGRMGLAALAAMRTALARFGPRERPTANRLVITVRPPWTIDQSAWVPLADAYAGLARGMGLEKVVLHIHLPSEAEESGTAGPGEPVLVDKILTLEGLGGEGMSIRLDNPGPNPIRPLTAYAQKVLTSARFGVPYPYEIVRMLTPGPSDSSPFPRGAFVELDLGDDDELVPVVREPGKNTAHLIVGTLTSFTEVHPEGIRRVAILSDPTQGLGNLAEPECRRINAALALALRERIPVEWYAVSSGALIAMDSGTENMDWIALTLRRLIEYTQAGGEVNIIVTGINVGGQPYWNAEATMLMHTKGILVMTPASTMVLTGKQALDFSGAVSADDNAGIGGYDRVMGPNGQAQYWAPSFPEACSLLLQHYDLTYVVPGERFPRRRPTSDPTDRDVRSAPHAPTPGSLCQTVGDVFSPEINPERKQPFDMRSVMRSVTDADAEPLERWLAWQDADTSIVWDATVGGIPVCMIGLESRSVPRRGFVPSYGPPAWTSGTLFPQSSRKTARAVNAASGNRPLVVLANLSGFDGSPESMRNWQLEYGAEIGRAVTNFVGPIVFVVVSRYHGGAFVVFSKALNSAMEIAAVEGSYASVIGGAPAAATVFAREVKQRTEADERVVSARAEAAATKGAKATALRARVARVVEEVRSERLREVADEFDSIHTIERALRVGSVDLIIEAARLRPYVVDALERGMAKHGGR